MASAQHARFAINCIECRKPRVLYTVKALRERNLVELVAAVTEFDYTCGAPILPPGHPVLQFGVYTKANLRCADEVEIPYYSSRFGRLDICCQCGGEEAIVDQVAKQEYKTVLPLCPSCAENGLETIKQRPYGKGIKKIIRPTRKVKRVSLNV